MTQQIECPHCQRLVPEASLVPVSVNPHKGTHGDFALIRVCEMCLPIVKAEIERNGLPTILGLNARLTERQIQEQVKELEQHRAPVLFRIHAYAKDLEMILVRRILDYSSDDPSILRRYEDEHDGIAGIEFSDGPPFQTWNELEEWQRPAFRNLVAWLRKKSEEEQQQIKTSELTN